LPAILEEHGISADLHVLPITGQNVFGKVLLAKAREQHRGQKSPARRGFMQRALAAALDIAPATVSRTT
jgi:hypothetical protein